MIVNYTENGWQIITQRSHGLLAAQICARWKKDKQPGRWVDTLIATAEHDDVYNELENEDLVNENGGPVNFKQTEFEAKKSEALIAMAETKSAFIALLISRHIQFVHGSEPKAKPFFAKLANREKDWLQIANTTKGEISKAYELLEFCDAFSLLICQQLIQPEQRKIQISNGPEGEPYEMFASGDKLIVAPWPFEVASFPVSYEVRLITQLSFNSSDEFKKEFQKANVMTQYLTISKS